MTSRPIVGGLALASALAVLFVVGPAHAQDYEAAQRHYLAGEDAAERGNHDVAVIEYLAAYDITKAPVLFKTIAKTYEAAGRTDEAVTYYQRYLDESTDLDPAERATVEAHLGEIQGPAPDLPPVEDTGIDDQPAVDVGPPPSFTDESPRWQETAAWVSVGLAAVCLGTGGVLGFSASSREEDIQNLIAYRDPVTGLPKEYDGTIRADYEDKVDEGATLETYALGAFVGAGAFAAAAAVFFYLDATAPPKRVQGAQVVPFLTPDSGGVAAGWSF